MFKKFLRDTSGATAIEYGLIAAFISAALIVGVASVGTNTTVVMTEIATKFSLGPI